MQITLEHTVQTAVAPTPNVRAVASMFGLGLDQTRAHQLIPETTIDLAPGQLIFVTGPSGSGKSTLLHLIKRNLTDPPQPTESELLPNASIKRPSVLNFNHLPEPQDRPLVDQFGDRSLDHVLRLLGQAGLSDAFVMLRTPSQLSDGQRYRFNLARCFAHLEPGQTPQSTANPSSSGKSSSTDPPSPSPPEPSIDIPLAVFLADEFGAALDRTTAHAIAAHLRRHVTRTHIAAVVATTHDDLLEPLRPDVLLEKPLGPTLHVHTA